MLVSCVSLTYMSQSDILAVAIKTCDDILFSAI